MHFRGHLHLSISPPKLFLCLTYCTQLQLHPDITVYTFSDGNYTLQIVNGWLCVEIVPQQLYFQSNSESSDNILLRPAARKLKQIKSDLWIWTHYIWTWFYKALQGYLTMFYTCTMVQLITVIINSPFLISRAFVTLYVVALPGFPDSKSWNSIWSASDTQFFFPLLNFNLWNNTLLTLLW